MELSYWEYKTWLSQIDFTIVGSGLVGLSCALELKEKHPSAKILILEKGILPQGASTKNAGFACFGSASEILSDLQTHSENEVVELVKHRWEGIQALRNHLGDQALNFQVLGGHEVFLKEKTAKYHECLDKLSYLNGLLTSVFREAVFKETPNQFHFENSCTNYITHTKEGQLDTGKMVAALVHKVHQADIPILNSVTVEAYEEVGGKVKVKTNRFEFETVKLLIATNGFAPQLVEQNVSPARAQVLITQPIKDLHIKGTFHLEEGYYYFRNIENRVLLGGGRNLDYKAEETQEFGLTPLVQSKLEELLREVILPNTDFVVDRRWSGIMGIGKQKNPIIKQLSNHVFCGVRLGGMGVALGSWVGKELAKQLF